ncbi:MAG: hypothetical protein HYX27_25645 [Acidobacteria bacterium]|nr:hypothetical protein [Acidobacteriota bacterium]
MWQRIGLALFAATVIQAKELQISVGPPPACTQAQTLRLTLLDVDFPANVVANIRAFAAPGIYVGMLSFVASEKPRKLPRAEIAASPEFRRWLEETKPEKLPPITLRPQGPARKPLTIEWTIRSATWSCR